MSDSPFLRMPSTAWVAANELAFAVRDGFPVSTGHTLVIPRRHVPTWFEATSAERAAIFELVDRVKRDLDATFQPHGYNVGFNAGEAAGQTVMHLHVHVIPRYAGDMENPEGGVRGVIPGRQKYRTLAPVTGADPFDAMPSFVPGEEQGLRTALREALDRALHVDLLSAFVQRSGLDEVEGHLVDALGRDAQVRVLTGDYLGITHPHALQRLYTLQTAWPRLEARLWRSGDLPFHPKAYVFRAGPFGVAFVGSSNLSRSALVDGVEWNLRVARPGSSTSKRRR